VICTRQQLKVHIRYNVREDFEISTAWVSLPCTRFNPSWQHTGMGVSYFCVWLHAFLHCSDHLDRSPANLLQVRALLLFDVVSHQSKTACRCTMTPALLLLSIATLCRRSNGCQKSMLSSFIAHWLTDSLRFETTATHADDLSSTDDHCRAAI